MATSPGRDQQEIDPSGVSLVSSVSPDADGAVVLDKVIDDRFVGSRADALDAEAGYYGHRAMQEQQALGPGYYVASCLIPEEGSPVAQQERAA